MGWKSTVEVSRQRAIQLIIASYGELHLFSNEELGNMLDGIYGDNPNIPHYGDNFVVRDDK